MQDFLIKLADQHIKSGPNLGRRNTLKQNWCTDVYDDVYDDNKVFLNYSYQYYLQR